MKPIKGELYNSVWTVVHDKVLKHAPYGSPVCKQIEKNLGWWCLDDSLLRLKIRNPKVNIVSDLNETD